MTTEIFEVSSYKKAILDQVSSLPNGGRGEFRKIAAALKVHSSLISQVFNGDKHLTTEQAADLSQYLGLSSLETEYFVTLVSYERAGTTTLRGLHKKQLEALRKRSLSVAQRIEAQNEFNEEDRALFYSRWYYSAIRLITSIKGKQTPESIAKALNLPLGLVREVLQFLVARKLCGFVGGEYIMGPTHTHVPATSPLVVRHHVNWRLKAVEKMEAGFWNTGNEIFYTSPVTLSQEDFQKLQKMVLEFLERAVKVIKKSPSETMACLNIDLFQV